MPSFQQYLLWKPLLPSSYPLLWKASCHVQDKQREAVKVVLWTGEGLASLLEEKEEHPGISFLFHGQSYKAFETPCKAAGDKCGEERNFISNPWKAIKESELNSPMSGCKHSQTSHNDICLPASFSSWPRSSHSLVFISVLCNCTFTCNVIITHGCFCFLPLTL